MINQSKGIVPERHLQSRRHGRLLRTLPAAALILALLGACGANPSERATTEDEALVENLPTDEGSNFGPVESPPEESTTTTLPGQITYSADGTLETSDGYRLGVEFNLALSAPRLNPLDEKPGFTSVQREIIDSSWEVTNLLPERNSSIGYLFNGGPPEVYGLYAIERPICQYFGLGDRGLTTAGVDGERCWLKVGYLQVDAKAKYSKLAAGGSVGGSIYAIADMTETSLALGALSEDDAPAIRDDLARSPDETAVVFEFLPGGGTFEWAVKDVTCALDWGNNSEANLLYVFEGTQATGLSQARC